MKYLMALILGLGFSLSSQAEEPGLESVYASQLCHIVAGESQASNAQFYLDRMRTENGRGQSPSALSETEFSEDTAQELISAWLELDEKDRQALRVDNNRCQQTLMMQFQQED